MNISQQNMTSRPESWKSQVTNTMSGLPHKGEQNDVFTMAWVRKAGPTITMLAAIFFLMMAFSSSGYLHGDLGISLSIVFLLWTLKQVSEAKAFSEVE